MKLLKPPFKSPAKKTSSAKQLNGNICTMGELQFGAAIKEFLDRSRLNNGVKALQLTDTWEQLMGKTIARYTDKIEVVNRTLFIHTKVAPLRQELMYQREKIVERVNESLGANTITEVVIR